MTAYKLETRSIYISFDFMCLFFCRGCKDCKDTSFELRDIVFLGKLDVQWQTLKNMSMIASFKLQPLKESSLHKGHRNDFLEEVEFKDRF